jgi:hypothetical protein
MEPKKTPDFRNAMSYLKHRGVTIFDILKYRIGYCENGDYMAVKLLFLVMTVQVN